jgi:hypothetical protein
VLAGGARDERGLVAVDAVDADEGVVAEVFDVFVYLLGGLAGAVAGIG